MQYGFLGPHAPWFTSEVPGAISVEKLTPSTDGTTEVTTITFERRVPPTLPVALLKCTYGASASHFGALD